MSNLDEFVRQIFNCSDREALFLATDESILNICLDSTYFNKLYHIRMVGYGYGYDSDEEDISNILDELLECKKIYCILQIFKNSEINTIIANCDYCRQISIYEKLIKCDLISDADIITICKNYKPICIRKHYFDDDDYYGTYTKITNIFKYILDYRPQYAKYLVTIINDEFCFWYYILLEDKDAYSEMLKDLLISNIYEFNRIQQKIALEGSIIVYGYNIHYIDTIILIMEVIEKYSTKLKINIDFNIYIGLKIVLNGVFPPEMYSLVFNDNTGDTLRRNIYFIIAFCYLNYFEDANIEILEDFCQSIYMANYRRRCNIDIGIREAINRAPNTSHLQKYKT